MKRTLKLLVVAGVVCGLIAGAALAAASPTVVTDKATKVTDTTAVLDATVNPNGNRTEYAFAYGPTTAYGAATPTVSAGAGTKAVAESRTITGLTPGTVYHYRVDAVNAGGSAAGADRTFTTAGHPPAAVVTGAPVDVGKTVATATGTINPEGAITTWVVQYGTNPDALVQTPAQTIAAGTAPVPVGVQLTGLAPGTLFYYRVAASHAAFASTGALATFFTEPTTRPKPRLVAHTSPSRDRRSPYTFTTHGTLDGATSIPAAQRCAGNVGIRYYNGRRQLAFVVAPVAPNCTFSAPARFRRLHGRGPVRLNVRVDYRGTGYVRAATRIDHVTAG